MDERQIGLALALKELGASVDISGFDSRLILQKTVYLIEQAGIKLGYGFNWYLRGPYSPGLTRDLFDLASSQEDVAGWVLDSRSQTIARNLRTLFDQIPNESQSAKATRLELLASLHYLACRERVNVADSKKAKDQLAENGKRYSADEVEAAIADLKQFSLL